MKVENLTPEALVGRWIFYRRLRGAVFSKLTRSFVQEVHPGNIIGLVGGIAFEASDYPRRPKPWYSPWFEALDELEIHAVVDPVDVKACGHPPGPCDCPPPLPPPISRSDPPPAPPQN